MALLNPPGSIDDFQKRPAIADKYAMGWDTWLRFAIESARRGDRRRAPAPRFDVPVLDPPTTKPAPFPWDAFPRVIKQWYKNDPTPDETRWRVAEILHPVRIGHFPDGTPAMIKERQQDEYCEWFVHGRSDDIRRIDFTCEGPEYWQFLAGGTDVLFRAVPAIRDQLPPFSGDMTLVLELYRAFVSEEVEPDDLVWPENVLADDDGFHNEGEVIFNAGDYNPHNKWNTTHGAMHLTHHSNTLGAEINLAADGTKNWTRGGEAVTDQDDLACSTGIGDPNRSSDPAIAAGVNAAASGGRLVALANPIGLYISDISRDAFKGPAGWSFEQAWGFRRGSEGRMLRTSLIGSPDGKIPIRDIRVNAQPIRSGSQVADTIQMILFGEVHGEKGPRVEVPIPPGTTCCEDPSGRLVAQCGFTDWDDLKPDEGTDEAVATESSVDRRTAWQTRVG
jgi:hypothetical protein